MVEPLARHTTIVVAMTLSVMYIRAVSARGDTPVLPEARFENMLRLII